MYLSADQRMMSVAIRSAPSFEADVPKPLFAARVLFPGSGPRTHYVMSADGQRFLLAAPRGGGALAGSSVVLNWIAELRLK